MMARPSVRALIEWRALPGTRATGPARDAGFAVDGHFQLAFGYFVNFFLRMEVFVNGRAAFEVVMREGHVRGMEIAAEPAGQAFDYFQAAGVNKSHKRLLGIILARVVRGGREAPERNRKSRARWNIYVRVGHCIST